MGILNENPKQQTHVLVVCTVWPGIWKYVYNIQINKQMITLTAIPIA